MFLIMIKINSYEIDILQSYVMFFLLLLRNVHIFLLLDYLSFQTNTLQKGTLNFLLAIQNHTNGAFRNTLGRFDLKKNTL